MPASSGDAPGVRIAVEPAGRCGCEDLVGGVVSAVGLDGLERVERGAGVMGCAFERLHVGEDAAVGAG